MTGFVLLPDQPNVHAFRYLNGMFIVEDCDMPAAFRVPTLSGKERVVLELLTRDGELYGLQMVAASKRRLKRGTIYVTLGRMETKGYVTSRIRTALGAASADVIGLVLARVAMLVAIGVAIGAGASVWAAKFVAT